MPSRLAKPCSVVIEFTLKPGKRREFSRAFEDLIGHQRDGHIRTAVFEDREEPGHMVWIADWNDSATAAEYLRSEQFGILLGAVRVLSSDASCRLIAESQNPQDFPTLQTERRPVNQEYVELDPSRLRP
ncbi:MAG: antibiotic biosynthesis monooxygenase [Acidobacteria bacterium]|nr:antibiotic biosynthesis monooxygenase [Acidobacteriota bacterium]